jgi:hypothetical protein
VLILLINSSFAVVLLIVDKLKEKKDEQNHGGIEKERVQR